MSIMALKLFRSLQHRDDDTHDLSFPSEVDARHAQLGGLGRQKSMEKRRFDSVRNTPWRFACIRERF